MFVSWYGVDHFCLREREAGVEVGWPGRHGEALRFYVGPPLPDAHRRASSRQCRRGSQPQADTAACMGCVAANVGRCAWGSVGCACWYVSFVVLFSVLFVFLVCWFLEESGIPDSCVFGWSTQPNCPFLGTFCWSTGADQWNEEFLIPVFHSSMFTIRLFFALVTGCLNGMVAADYLGFNSISVEVAKSFYTRFPQYNGRLQHYQVQQEHTLHQAEDEQVDQELVSLRASASSSSAAAAGSLPPAALPPMTAAMANAEISAQVAKQVSCYSLLSVDSLPLLLMMFSFQTRRRN